MSCRNHHRCRGARVVARRRSSQTNGTAAIPEVAAGAASYYWRECYFWSMEDAPHSFSRGRSLAPRARATFPRFFTALSTTATATNAHAWCRVSRDKDVHALRPGSVPCSRLHHSEITVIHLLCVSHAILNLVKLINYSEQYVNTAYFAVITN